MPRVVIGALLFNHADHFRPAIESLLAQTFTDFALLLLDDGSTDSTPELAREYEARDARVSYRRNETRLGLTGNSRQAFRLARELYPEADYFAWASDHDLWHPEWLQRLVAALDADPALVAAYPLNRRIGVSGEVLKRKPWVFDTAGIASRSVRMRRAIRHMRAGNMVYGLYRVGPLERAGVYRNVLVPDRLLFAELSLYGPFKQVPQVLWFRRWYGRVFSLGRQRESFFPGRRPSHAYLPWWISHAASLFSTLTVHGAGKPDVTRTAGVWVALQYLVLGALAHTRQTLRAIRGRAIEGGAVLRHRVRLARRAVRDLGFHTVRRPGLLLLRWLRRVPVMRKHLIPSLLKPELEQIPAAEAAAAVDRALEQLQKRDLPLVIGPWVGEVGFELLYWIPFLNRTLRTYGLDRRRLIVVSRGGAAPWYRHLTSEYLDVFSLFSLEEYRQANEERWDKAGHQKQYRVERMDLEIVERAKARLGLSEVELLHPSLMYRTLRFYWFDKAGAALLNRYTEYRRLATPEPGPALEGLPSTYVAVRFYFRPSFPDTPENRRFAVDTIRSISRHTPVVLLNTGLRPDEHEDLDVPGSGIYRVDDRMTLERNLEVQTAVVSRAQAFVGTYGGLAYLGPFYGVPSVAFYSTESELVAAHLDASWRLGGLAGVPVTALHTRHAPLLQILLGRAQGAGSSSLAAPSPHVVD